MHIKEPATRNFLEVDVQPKLMQPLRYYRMREVLLKQVTQIIDNNTEELVTTLQAIAEKLRQFLDTQQIVIYSFDNNHHLLAPDCLISPFNSNHTDSNNSIAVPIFTRNFNVDGAETKKRVVWGMLIALGCNIVTCSQQCTTLKLIAREIGIAIQQAQLLTKLQSESSARSRVEAQTNEYIQQIDEQTVYIAQIQQQLLSKEKIATLGELIVDLVEEIHNPVEFIFATLKKASQYAEDLIQLLEFYESHSTTPARHVLQHLKSPNIDFIKTDFIKILWSLRAGSEQLQQTVSALHNFSGNNGQIKKINLNQALNGAITILHHRLKQQENRPAIEIAKDLKDIPLVECLPGEINQVFISLLINAIEALEKRINYDYSFIPKIWIRTEIVHTHLSLLNSTFAHGKQKQKVLIHIYDNGSGILPHIQRRMFEPFFTTKPTGKGTGLGLALARQIIEQNHRGKLRCNSQLGHGTEFVIEICTAYRHYANIKKRASF